MRPESSSDRYWTSSTSRAAGLSEAATDRHPSIASRMFSSKFGLERLALGNG